MVASIQNYCLINYENDSKEIHHQMKDIKERFKNYYKNRYSHPYTDNDQKMETLFESLKLPTLTKDQNKALVSQITEEEIYAAIARLKNNKSPGADGFTLEWYKNLKYAGYNPWTGTRNLLNIWESSCQLKIKLD